MKMKSVIPSLASDQGTKAKATFKADYNSGAQSYISKFSVRCTGAFGKPTEAKKDRKQN